jgi:hypothetical protein
MDDPGLWLAIVAILVSGGSLYYTHKADKRARRADKRAERAESAARRAHVIVEAAGGSGTPGETVPRPCNFNLRNVGASPATDVRLWLTDRHVDERVVSSVAAASVLAPGDPPARLAVDLRAPLTFDEVELWLGYTDDDGPHEERVDTRPR